MVVLQEKDDGRLVRLGKNERFVGVPFARCTITEIDNRRFVDVGFARSRFTVHRDTHRVARGVQGLRRENECVQAESRFVRVPAAVRNPAKQ